jgi:pyrimidine-nucleoside phosphorylase
MLVPALIERKRNGGALSAEEWRELLTAYHRGSLPDYQMAVLLMAVYFRGLADGELQAITRTMLDSGRRLTPHGSGRPRADKHSTGGVGDKTSLILAPWVASCGVDVPMISGRGLGHTGGTLDKLESIPGFRTDLSLAEAGEVLDRLGCALVGQTAELAPIDRKLYALRDVTATVESLPLIAASIMSKKLAEGLNGLVLDVKTGSGAFLPDPDQSLALAKTMIALGEAEGCRTVALLTAMDRPLGRACGNALEVEECLMALQGQGPADLMAVTQALAAEMLVAAGAVASTDAALERLGEALASGRAMETFGRIIEAQGGNPAVVDDPALLPQAEAVEVFEAARDGVVVRVDPRTIGRAIVALGGGRTAVGDTIDPSVGFVITTKPGDRVVRGEGIASVFARDDAGTRLGLAALRDAITIGEEGVLTPLISHRVTAAGVEPLAGSGRPAC